jgi:uncharacterized BrkB/YihY/UPF0761 family membrane protein
MRSIDDQMTEIFRRSNNLKEKKKVSNAMIGYIVSIAACLALMVVTAIMISGMNTESSISSMSRYGSLIITAPYMGYVIVGLLAFVLGMLITLLCKKMVDLKKLEDFEDNGK